MALFRSQESVLHALELREDIKDFGPIRVVIVKYLSFGSSIVVFQFLAFLCFCLFLPLALKEFVGVSGLSSNGCLHSR